MYVLLELKFKVQCQSEKVNEPIGQPQSDHFRSRYVPKTE